MIPVYDNIADSTENACSWKNYSHCLYSTFSTRSFYVNNVIMYTAEFQIRTAISGTVSGLCPDQDD